MTTKYIETGDYVRDPLDGPNAPLKRVTHVEIHGSGPATLYLAGGGIMGADEVEEVYLPSEVE